jgi:hypothetical protein
MQAQTIPSKSPPGGGSYDSISTRSGCLERSCISGIRPINGSARGKILQAIELTQKGGIASALSLNNRD